MYDSAGGKSKNRTCSKLFSKIRMIKKNHGSNSKLSGKTVPYHSESTF